MNSFRYLHRATSVGFAAFTGLALATGCCTKKTTTASYHTQPASYAAMETTAEPAPAPTPTPTGRTEGGSNMVVQLYEEKVNVGKREVEGSVRLKKVVKTETINQPIELRHEELVIERESGGAAQGEKALGQPFQEQETVIRLKNEVPVVEKQTTATGQIVVNRRSSATQTNIQTQARREDINIDRQGNTENVTIGQNVQSSGASSGAAETPSGKAAGAGASASITDPTSLNSSDASQLVGKRVQLSGLKVRNVMGDKVIVLDGGNDRQIYVFNKEGSASCKPGDIVNVNGSIKASADAASAGEAAQELSSRPYYIEAEKIEVSNK